MPQARNLPCVQCPSCSKYEYEEHSSYPHRCKDSTIFNDRSKIGQHPDKEGTGTNCKKYKPA